MGFNKGKYQCNKCGEKEEFRLIELDLLTFTTLFIIHLLITTICFCFGITLGLAMVKDIETGWQMIAVLSCLGCYIFGYLFGKLKMRK